MNNLKRYINGILKISKEIDKPFYSGLGELNGKTINYKNANICNADDVEKISLWQYEKNVISLMIVPHDAGSLKSLQIGIACIN